MASGKTLELNQFTRLMSYRRIEPRETYYRDRSLRGKARRKARKQSRREN